jgi:polyisoprenoid-binding protein YceI
MAFRTSGTEASVKAPEEPALLHCGPVSRHALHVHFHQHESLRPVTRSGTFKLKRISVGSYVATSAIKRSEFGIAFGIPKAKANANDVDLRINIESVGQ